MTSNCARTAEDLKAERERAIFARFASLARPDIDLATVQSCRPRAPDIACSTASGERLAFELAELCPPEVAKAVGDDIKPLRIPQFPNKSPRAPVRDRFCGR